MRLEVDGIGGDGAAVGGLGVGGLVERVLGGGEVEEDVRVGGVLLGEGGEELEGSGEVLVVEGVRGLGAEGVWGLLGGLRGGVRGAGGELGLCLRGGEEEDGRQERDDDGEAAAGLEARVSVWCRHRDVGTLPPVLKYLKSSSKTG